MKTNIVFSLVMVVLAAQGNVFGGGMLKSGVQTFPGIVSKDAPQDLNLDLSKEKFFVSAPKSYTGNQPFGILVFVSPSDESITVPPGWETVLQERKLIYIAPQRAGNKQEVSRRANLAIAAACKLVEMAKINTNRIYLAGFSGGARIASYTAFLRPDLFSGVFANCGVDFPRAVPRVKATEKDQYGVFSIDEKQAAETKGGVRFVLVTGPKDFRYGNILDIYSGGYMKDGYAVKLINVPGMDHALCTPKVFSDGLAFIDKKPGGTAGGN